MPGTNAQRLGERSGGNYCGRDRASEAGLEVAPGKGKVKVEAAGMIKRISANPASNRGASSIKNRG